MSPKAARKLKGVIPPTITDPQEQWQVIRRVREFLKQFPGLAEEVMKLREQEAQQYYPYGRPPFTNRDELRP